MKYLVLICDEGGPAPEDLDAPDWVGETGRRGVRPLGRELDAPGAAATVRVRDGETLVSGGPFIETKEFVAGVDVVRCAGRQQATELVAAHPIARFHAIEVRPFAGQ